MLEDKQEDMITVNYSKDKFKKYCQRGCGEKATTRVSGCTDYLSNGYYCSTHSPLNKFQPKE